MLNSQPGKSIISLSSEKKDTTKKKIKTPPSPEELERVMSTAESSIDMKNVRNSTPNDEVSVVRTYKITSSNIKKMENLSELQGTSYSWQINRALEYWFENNHPNPKLAK